MEKTLEILEKYCQWLAVGIGGLFLGWMLWSYILMSPTAVTVNGTTYEPGTVDDIVKKNNTEPLELAMKQEGAVQVPAQSDANQLENWMTELNGPTTSVALVPTWINSRPSNIAVGPIDSGTENKTVAVTALPELPPSSPVEIKAARAYIGPPLPPAGTGTPPAEPTPAPTVPLAPGATPPPPPGHDQSYVRLTYRIPTTEIAEAFKSANVPQTATTGVVAIKLVRQERQADGKWSEATDVPYLKNNVTIMPLPPAGASAADVNTFRTWSDSPEGQTALLRPAFYPIVFGEGPWDPPSEDSLPKYDPEAIRAEKARIAKEAADAKKRNAPTVPQRSPRSSGRRGGPSDEPATPDYQRPANLGGMIGVQYPVPRPAVGAPGMDGETMPPTDAQPAQPVAPGAGQPPAEVLPATVFQPATTPAFLCWAYDETVQEGHTYRYQVLYAIRSPVYESNITKPPQLAQVFSIWSKPDDKGWTNEVEVKPTAEYYLATTNWTVDRIPASIKVDVFKWAQGKWQTQTFPVSPGDKIGELKNGVDYSTDTTVVDFRYDPRGNGGQGRPYVLLLTADGRLIEREPTADRNNTRMLQLKQAIQLATPPVPGAAQPGAMPPGARGGPTGGEGPVPPGGN